MRATNALTIGALARRGGVNIQTIRYYERRGLILESGRSASGYRIYNRRTVNRLGFIRKAQQLGFSLQEIEELLSLRTRPGTSCADVREQTRRKIAAIEEKIAELTRIRDALARLVRACRGKGPTSECPALEALDAGTERWR